MLGLLSERFWNLTRTIVLRLRESKDLEVLDDLAGVIRAVEQKEVDSEVWSI
jgi:hypothetical protein